VPTGKDLEASLWQRAFSLLSTCLFMFGWFFSCSDLSLIGAKFTLTNAADSELTVRIMSPLSSDVLMPPSREYLKKMRLKDG